MQRGWVVALVLATAGIGCNVPANRMVGDWTEDNTLDGVGFVATYSFHNDGSFTFHWTNTHASNDTMLPGCVEAIEETGTYDYRETGGCHDVVPSDDGACRNYEDPAYYLTLRPRAGTRQRTGCRNASDDLPSQSLAPSDYPTGIGGNEQSITMYDGNTAILPGGYICAKQ